MGHSSTFALSSRVLAFTGTQLAAQGVRPAAQRDRSIDDGVRGWQDWFRLNWGHPTLWTATTRKIKDPLWRGPQGGRLAFGINPANDSILYVSVTRNDWGAFGPGKGEYYAAIPLKADSEWITVNLGVEDFQPVDPEGAQPLTDWSTLTDLSLSGSVAVVKDGVRTTLPGIAWKESGTIRIRQLRWVGGQYQGDAPAAAGLPETVRLKAFDDSIQSSVEQEKQDIRK